MRTTQETWSVEISALFRCRWRGRRPGRSSPHRRIGSFGGDRSSSGPASMPRRCQNRYGRTINPPDQMAIVARWMNLRKVVMGLARPVASSTRPTRAPLQDRAGTPAPTSGGRPTADRRADLFPKPPRSRNAPRRAAAARRRSTQPEVPSVRSSPRARQVPEPGCAVRRKDCAPKEPRTTEEGGLHQPIGWHASEPPLVRPGHMPDP